MENKRTIDELSRICKAKFGQDFFDDKEEAKEVDPFSVKVKSKKPKKKKLK